MSDTCVSERSIKFRFVNPAKGDMSEIGFRPSPTKTKLVKCASAEMSEIEFPPRFKPMRLVSSASGEMSEIRFPQRSKFDKLGRLERAGISGDRSVMLRRLRLSLSKLVKSDNTGLSADILSRFGSDRLRRLGNSESGEMSVTGLESKNRLLRLVKDVSGEISDIALFSSHSPVRSASVAKGEMSVRLLPERFKSVRLVKLERVDTSIERSVMLLSCRDK